MVYSDQCRSLSARFEGAEIGVFNLNSRIVMAPFTLNRADPGFGRVVLLCADGCIEYPKRLTSRAAPSKLVCVVR